MCERIGSFARSPNWEIALQDPYLLVEMAFGAWYERLDSNAREVTDSCRNIEGVCMLSMLPPCAFKNILSEPFYG